MRGYIGGQIERLANRERLFLHLLLDLSDHGLECRPVEQPRHTPAQQCLVPLVLQVAQRGDLPLLGTQQLAGLLHGKRSVWTVSAAHVNKTPWLSRAYVQEHQWSWQWRRERGAGKTAACENPGLAHTDSAKLTHAPKPSSRFLIQRSS